MVKYACEKCGKVFSQKGHFTNHLKRKRPCKPIENKVIEEKVKKKLQELSKNGEIEIKNNERILFIKFIMKIIQKQIIIIIQMLKKQKMMIKRSTTTTITIKERLIILLIIMMKQRIIIKKRNKKKLLKKMEQLKKTMIRKKLLNGNHGKVQYVLRYVIKKIAKAILKAYENWC